MVVKLKDKKSQPAYLLIWEHYLDGEARKRVEEKLEKLNVNVQIIDGINAPTLVTFD